MQNRVQINDSDIWQPDQDMDWNYETTYTPDSTRTQDGTGHFTEMFTIESFGYKASAVPVQEGTKILQKIVGKKFDLFTWNPYFGKWMKHRCNVGEGSLSIGSLEEGGETYSSISFSAVDIKPLEAYT